MGDVTRVETEDKEEGDVLTPLVESGARTTGFSLRAGACDFFIFVLEADLVMIKMGRRRKTKTNEEPRKRGRRKHITEKGETQLGGCTKRMESVASTNTNIDEYRRKMN